MNQEVTVLYKKNSSIKYFELVSNDNVCVKLFFELESSCKNNRFNSDLINDLPIEKKPKSNDFKSISNMENDLNFYLEESCFKKLFPNLKKYSNAYQISALLTSTRLVGMECPGLNSIYSAFNFKFNNENKKTFYKVNKVSRFGMVSIKISGNFNGSIDAFIRPSSVKQLSFKK